MKKIIALTACLLVLGAWVFAQEAEGSSDEGLGLTVGAKFNFGDLAMDHLVKYNRTQLIPYVEYSHVFFEHLSIDAGLYLDTAFTNADKNPFYNEDYDEFPLEFGIMNSAGWDFGSASPGFQFKPGFTFTAGPGDLGFYLRNRLGGWFIPDRDYDIFYLTYDIRPEVKYTLPLAGSVYFDLNWNIPVAKQGYDDDTKFDHTLELGAGWGSTFGLGIDGWLDFNIPVDADLVDAEADGFYMSEFGVVVSYDGFKLGPGTLIPSLEVDFDCDWHWKDGADFSNLTFIPRVDYGLANLPLSFYLQTVLVFGDDDHIPNNAMFIPEIGVSYSF